jgi:hypothetical protein
MLICGYQRPEWKNWMEKWTKRDKFSKKELQAARSAKTSGLNTVGFKSLRTPRMS